MSVIKEITAGKLKVKVFETRQQLGEQAAKEMSDTLKRLLAEKEEVNVIFASAPSQNEFFEALLKIEGIEWNRVNAFHMDEYIGLDEDAPQGFGNFLRDRITNKVDFKAVYYFNGNAEDPEEECDRYAKLLEKFPTDIVCAGIGENGHLAFNDPPVASFKDEKMVKVVELEEACRQQQVNDGCFSKIEDVPTHAVTLTIPALMKGKYVFCMVPGKTKTEAVTRTVNDEISESCPATILRTHDNAIMYVDKDSGAGIL